MDSDFLTCEDNPYGTLDFSALTGCHLEINGNDATTYGNEKSAVPNGTPECVLSYNGNFNVNTDSANDTDWAKELLNENGPSPVVGLQEDPGYILPNNENNDSNSQVSTELQNSVDIKKEPLSPPNGPCHTNGEPGLTSLVEQNKELKLQCENYEKKLKEVLPKVETLERDRERIREQQNEFDTLNTKLIRQEEVIKQYKILVAQQKHNDSENESLKKKLKCKERAISKLKDQLAEIQQRSQPPVKKKPEHEKVEMNGYFIHTADGKNENMVPKRELETANKQIDELKMELSKLQEKLTNHNTEIELLRRTRSDSESKLEDRIHELETEVRHLKSEAEKNAKEMEMQSRRLAAAEDALNDSDEKLKNTEDLQELLEQRTGMVVLLSQKIENMETILKSKDTELLKHQEDIRILHEVIRKKEDMENLTRELIKAQLLIQQRNKKIDKLIKENSKLRQSYYSMQRKIIPPKRSRTVSVCEDDYASISSLDESPNKNDQPNDHHLSSDLGLSLEESPDKSANTTGVILRNELCSLSQKKVTQEYFGGGKVQRLRPPKSLKRKLSYSGGERDFAVPLRRARESNNPVSSLLPVISPIRSPPKKSSADPCLSSPSALSPLVTGSESVPAISEICPCVNPDEILSMLKHSLPPKLSPIPFSPRSGTQQELHSESMEQDSSFSSDAALQVVSPGIQNSTHKWSDVPCVSSDGTVMRPRVKPASLGEKTERTQGEEGNSRTQGASVKSKCPEENQSSTPKPLESNFEDVATEQTSGEEGNSRTRGASVKSKCSKEKKSSTAKTLGSKFEDVVTEQTSGEEGNSRTRGASVKSKCSEEKKSSTAKTLESKLEDVAIEQTSGEEGNSRTRGASVKSKCPEGNHQSNTANPLERKSEDFAHHTSIVSNTVSLKQKSDHDESSADSARRKSLASQSDAKAQREILQRKAKRCLQSSKPLKESVCKSTCRTTGTSIESRSSEIRPSIRMNQTLTGEQQLEKESKCELEAKEAPKPSKTRPGICNSSNSEKLENISSLGRTKGKQKILLRNAEHESYFSSVNKTECKSSCKTEDTNAGSESSELHPSSAESQSVTAIQLGQRASKRRLGAGSPFDLTKFKTISCLPRTKSKQKFLPRNTKRNSSLSSTMKNCKSNEKFSKCTENGSVSEEPSEFLSSCTGEQRSSIEQLEVKSEEAPEKQEFSNNETTEKSTSQKISVRKRGLYKFSPSALKKFKSISTVPRKKTKRKCLPRKAKQNSSFSSSEEAKTALECRKRRKCATGCSSDKRSASENHLSSEANQTKSAVQLEIKSEGVKTLLKRRIPKTSLQKSAKQVQNTCRTFASAKLKNKPTATKSERKHELPPENTGHDSSFSRDVHSEDPCSKTFPGVDEEKLVPSPVNQIVCKSEKANKLNSGTDLENFSPPELCSSAAGGEHGSNSSSAEKFENTKSSEPELISLDNKASELEKVETSENCARSPDEMMDHSDATEITDKAESSELQCRSAGEIDYVKSKNRNVESSRYQPHVVFIGKEKAQLGEKNTFSHMQHSSNQRRTSVSDSASFRTDIERSLENGLEKTCDIEVPQKFRQSSGLLSAWKSWSASGVLSRDRTVQKKVARSHSSPTKSKTPNSSLPSDPMVFPNENIQVIPTPSKNPEQIRTSQPILPTVPQESSRADRKACSSVTPEGTLASGKEKQTVVHSRKELEENSRINGFSVLPKDNSVQEGQECSITPSSRNSTQNINNGTDVSRNDELCFENEDSRLVIEMSDGLEHAEASGNSDSFMPILKDQSLAEGAEKEQPMSKPKINGKISALEPSHISKDDAPDSDVGKGDDDDDDGAVLKSAKRFRACKTPLRGRFQISRKVPEHEEAITASNNRQIRTLHGALKNLEQIRLKKDEYKRRKHHLVTVLLNPSEVKSPQAAAEKVAFYLSNSKRNPLMTFAETSDRNYLFPMMEACIVEALFEAQAKRKLHLVDLTDVVRQTLYEKIFRIKDMTPSCTYSMGCLARVFTGICQRKGNRSLVRNLFINIFFCHGPAAFHVLASIVGAWKDPFSQDKEDDSLCKVLNKVLAVKPRAISLEFWKQCSYAFKELLSLNPSSSLSASIIASSIIQNMVNSWEGDVHYDLFSLELLAVHEGWNWARQALLDGFVYYVIESVKEYPECHRLTALKACLSMLEWLETICPKDDFSCRAARAKCISAHPKQLQEVLGESVSLHLALTCPKEKIQHLVDWFKNSKEKLSSQEILSIVSNYQRYVS